MDRKDAQAVMEHTAKSAQHAMGKANGMSGRDLFSFNPNLGQVRGILEHGDKGAALIGCLRAGLGRRGR